MTVSPWETLSKCVLPMEAGVGIVLNAVLLALLWRKNIDKSAQLYRISCMITALMGLWTSILLLLIQAVAVFLNGSMAVVVLYGPILEYTTICINDLLVVSIITQIQTMWKMISAPAILQWMSLARPSSGTGRRILYAYSIPLLFYLNSWNFVQCMIPSDGMRDVLTNGIREFHSTNLSSSRIYGAKLQDDNSTCVMDIMVYDVTSSYIASYFISIFTILKIRSWLGVSGITSVKTAQMHKQFFRTQIAQALLPLAFLFPFIFIFTFAALCGINLANITILVCYWLWMSPSATATLLLLFVVKINRPSSGAKKQTISSLAMTSPRR